STYFIETPCAEKVSHQGVVAPWSADRAGPQREEVDRDDTTDGREHGPAGPVRAVRLGQQLGRADVQEEPGEDREHQPQDLIRYRHNQSEQDAENGSDRDDRDP